MLRSLTQVQLPTANKTLQSCYRHLEARKRHEYQDRMLNVEHGSFSPLIFSTSGSMGPTASVVFRRLASLLSIKRDEHYSKTILFIRCQLGFALLHSAVRCLCGTRSKFTPGLANTNIDLALSEGRVSYWTICFFLIIYLFSNIMLYTFTCISKQKKKINKLKTSVYTSNGVYSQGFSLYTHLVGIQGKSPLQGNIRYISLAVPLILEAAMVQICIYVFLYYVTQKHLFASHQL